MTFTSQLKSNPKPLFIFYLISLLSFCIYSYSQVDLNLTLSSNYIYQQLQTSLTHLGYFNRPLSTLIYIVSLTMFTASYFLLIHHPKSIQFKFSKYIKILTIAIILLLFAYPAFSYDIFNYIFDTRILIHHTANPYTHTALDFPSDLWTRFMRWTHRTYPYGPTWILTTIPFYILGLGKFTLTLLTYKLIGTLSYLLSVFSIYKISKKINPKLATHSTLLFALNPLIVIESLLSPHLDITMAALMLFALHLYLSKRHISSFFFFIYSILIKYVSFALAPFIFLHHLKKINITQTLTYATFFAYLLTLIVISQREILPWYFTTPFALTALLPKNRLLKFIMFGLTPASLLRYAPFLYIGDYTPWVISTRNLLTFIIMAITLAIYLITAKHEKNK